MSFTTLFVTATMIMSLHGDTVMDAILVVDREGGRSEDTRLVQSNEENDPNERKIEGSFMDDTEEEDRSTLIETTEIKDDVYNTERDTSETVEEDNWSNTQITLTGDELEENELDDRDAFLLAGLHNGTIEQRDTPGTTTFMNGYYNADIGIDPDTLIILQVIGSLCLAGAIILIVVKQKWFGKWSRVFFILRTPLVTVLLCIGVVIFISILYVDRSERNVPMVFSEKTMINLIWEGYVEQYVDSETYRTIDRQRSNVTTSEGQGYTMLRAVWVDDKEVFDNTWQWTQNNLQQRPGDELFAWIYGERENGNEGILIESGGMNVASDADVDIALALIFAYSRWQDEQYLEDALAIIPDIWDRLVVEIDGEPVLAANDIEKQSQNNTVMLNPSYFSPSAYRIFAELDPQHDWMSLVDSSYDILLDSMAEPLDKESSVGLPPDWVQIDRTTGELMVPTGHSTHYSYEALRIPWRIALDHVWYDDPRAEEVLKNFSFIENEWEDNKRIVSTYARNGTAVTDYEIPAMYGGSLGYFVVFNEDMAEQVYRQKLLVLYDPGRGWWRGNGLSYYDDNIVWFGMALYNDSLPNLFSLNFR